MSSSRIFPIETVDPISSQSVGRDGRVLSTGRTLFHTMTKTIEISDELAERIEPYLEDDETIEEFIEELISIYEQEGRFLQEGA